MPVEKQSFTATEIKAGTLVLVSLLLLAGFAAAVRGCRPGGAPMVHYHALFANTRGLDEGANVRFGGVKVGRVTVIEPDPENRTRIRVTAEVLRNVPVNAASVATIEQITLTSEMHLEISTGNAKAELLGDGAMLKSKATPAFGEVPNLEGVTSRLESVLDGLNSLLGTQTGGAPVVSLADVTTDLQKTLRQTSKVVENVDSLVAENREDIHNALKQLVKLVADASRVVGEFNAVVEENRAPLHATATNLEQLTADARTRLDGLADSLSSTLDSLEKVGGTADHLVDREAPAIEEIVRNLREVTRNLREFSRILAEQPQALIRGARPQGRPSGERP